MLRSITICAQLPHGKYAQTQQALIWAGLSINFCPDPRKHFPGHRGMAMPDRFWVKLKNQTNFELLSKGKILSPNIFKTFDLNK